MDRVNILLVDDRPENLLALEATLSELPVECIEASSGSDAVRVARETDFAVVLLDVHMPEMDGFETAAALRQQQRSKATPIIFVTAMDRDDRHVLSAYSLGAVDYLFKPLDPDILVSKLRVFVELHQQRKMIEHQATELTEQIRGLEEAREDIRSKEELLEQLRAAKEEAEAASRTKSTFLANMSHELRTPLHGIISFSGFGIKNADTDERKKLREYFEDIRVSGDTLLALLNDLLDLAKLEAGKMTLRRRHTDVRVLVTAVIQEVAAYAEERRVTIVCEESDDDFLAAVDGDRIKQVVRNLLSNSIKFSPEGGVAHVGFRLNDSLIEVILHDQGVGIPEDELTSVFEKFVQSSRTKTGAGGTGLGLAICRQIVVAHGGSIWAENAQEGGAVFGFQIPIEAPEPSGPVETTCSAEVC